MRTLDLKAFHEGNPRCFRELMRDLNSLLLAVTNSFAVDGDHADELIQMTWVRAYEKRHLFAGTGEFSNWIARLCSNVCVQESRTRAQQRALLERVRLDGFPESVSWLDPLEALSLRERTEAIYQAMTTLTDKEFEVFTMTYEQELSSEEIGPALGLSPSTVRVHLANARAKIRSLLGRKT